MKIDTSKLQPDRGYLLGSIDAIHDISPEIAKDYKKNIAKRFMSINPKQLDDKVIGKDFFLTRKYDGEFNLLIFDGETACLLNPGGKVRAELPCLAEAARLLQAAGLDSAVFACEVCMQETHERARVFHTLTAWADPQLQADLTLVPFDIVEINGEPLLTTHYEEQYQQIVNWFPGSKLVFPPRAKKAANTKEIAAIYAEWVEQENSEGIIIRNEYPLVYKLKPRHSADVVVVGYSEGLEEAQGQARSLLLALMPQEGKYQIIGRTGNGFSDELRKEVFERLQPMEMPSSYMEADSNHIAFHMIRPEIVLEVNFNDVLVENSNGLITNPVLEVVDGKYQLSSITPGFALIFPIFERFREDKAVNATDLRLSQVTDFVYITPAAEMEEGGEPSQVISRAVYRKENKGKLMVQKFIYWKTNKVGKNYPHYVFCYTNFSSDRKEPLNREVRISNSEAQIKEIYETYLKENVKKGWNEVEAA